MQLYYSVYRYLTCAAGNGTLTSSRRHMKKQALIGLSMTAVTFGVVGLSSIASAQTANGSSLIDKLVTKFNLNKADVQAVFDAEKSEKQAEHQAERSANLQTLVDKGTITADQKTKIEAKQKEQQAAREAERTSLEKWATDNGVEMRYLMGGRGHGTASDTRLQTLVDKGTITADQKTKIEAKQKELEAKREENKTAIEKWATDNGIDAKYLLGGGMGMRGHGGPKGEGPMGDN